MLMEQEFVKNMIELKNISKTFVTKNANFEVIKSLDLKVKENEFLAFFGPGQCGKTTIVNIIAGLEKPTFGEVIVNNKPVKGPGIDRGVVYQTISLFPWYTVMGNVEYGPRIRGVDKKTRREKAQYYDCKLGRYGRYVGQKCSKRISSSPEIYKRVCGCGRTVYPFLLFRGAPRRSEYMRYKIRPGLQ